MKAQETVGARAGVEGQLLQVFPLQSARTSNVSAGIAFLLILPWALLATGAAVAVALQIFTSLWVLIGDGALVALAAGLDWVTFRLFRETFPGRRYLALAPDALVLRHPLLLRRPIEIPLPAIERVAISSQTSDGFWRPQDFTLEKKHRGITWTASDEETVEALDGIARFFLPLASHVQTDEPNIAIVLRESIDLTELRRKPISSRSSFVRRLCDVDRARGFFLRLKDPDEAEKAFEERGLLGKLEGEQASLIDPTEDDAKRFRRWQIRRLIAWAVSVLLFASAVWELLDYLAR